MVIPRKLIHELEGFVAWSLAGELIDSVSDQLMWMPRTEAERSQEWVQPIPCAIFSDSHGRYCVFRQAHQGRVDLSRRISFIVGGHIDRDYYDSPIPKVFLETVRREVSEELGVSFNYELNPLGIVVDSSSLIASRHFGIVYKAVIDEDLRSLATEEFAVRSEYNGRLFDLESLSSLIASQRPRLRFDPWSFILFSQFLGRDFSKDIGHQPMLFTPTE